MREEAFEFINHFTQEEVETTGADINDVSVDTIHRLDLVRKKIDLPIQLVYNGITTGKHKSSAHPSGNAVDCRIVDIRTSKEALKVVMIASSVGFSGIGVYKNGAGFYNFHFEICDKLRFWGATMDETGSWDYDHSLGLNL
ncbi:MAG: hypothetical protein ACTSRU_20700 [Candidatus Hodarchaeales archaeon]